MDSTTSAISATTSALAAGVANAAGNSVAGAAAASAAAAVAARKQSASAPPPPPKQSTQIQRDPRSLQFQVDGNRVISTIVDENNNTVVVQIPDAEMIQLAKSIDRMQGFLVQEKA